MLYDSIESEALSMDENEMREVREYSEELLQMVEVFRQRIITGTSDPDNFLTISDIERLWTELRGDTSLLYSDMLSDLLANVDETKIIRKKKLNIGKKE
jgi:hypothetical protein